jgi:NAD(P)-dependent dehydrogenase (short-subunit alcohol dehydrogenase family)
MMNSSDSFIGKHALITGAAGGIGSAITHELAKLGMRLTLVGRQLHKLEALKASLPIHTEAQIIICDVTDSEGVDLAFAKAKESFGSINILINNAGQAISSPFIHTTNELWLQMLNANLNSAFYCSRAALPGMLETGWGRIINIASTAGQKGYAYVSAYTAAKHGLIGLTKSLALEVATKGVTVNAVCPGYTDTELLAKSLELVVKKTGRSIDQARNEFASQNPQKRIIQAVEVASTVSWLCSNNSSSIHGQSISVSGGEVM